MLLKRQPYTVRMLETGVIGLMGAGRSGRAAVTVIKTTSVLSRCPDALPGCRFPTLALGGRLHQRIAGPASDGNGHAASKFGVAGLARVAALDYASHGIRVNAIAPGPILTDGLAAAGQDAQHRAAAAVPLGRIGTPDDVAAAALWLCSDESSFTTGAIITVDGGRLAGTPAFNTRN